MPSTDSSLAAAVAKTVDALSAPALATLIAALRKGLGTETIRAAVPASAYKVAVGELLGAAEGVSADAVALALESVAASQRQAPRASIVWTGPTTNAVSVRRTDQALLQLINLASKRVIVVSFAVYNVPNVAATLEAAARRGVVVDLVVESEVASGGKVTFDGWKKFGNDAAGTYRVWTWARDRRPVTSSGKLASLHAKCAVSDGENLLVSSANLTEFALNVNMELGLLVKRGDIPARVQRHFDALMNAGELVRL